MARKSQVKGLQDVDVIDSFLDSFKWKRPTVPDMFTAACFLVTLVLYIIAISTNHWAVLNSGGYRVNFGLWSGCLTDQDGQTTCSSKILHTHVVDHNKVGDWHRAPQVFMILGLLSWFWEEFAILAHMFLKPGAAGRDILAGVNASLTAATGICLLLTVVMFNTGVSSEPDVRVSWSFVVAILALILTAATGATMTLPAYIEGVRRQWGHGQDT
ncbi:voltage-dependent calcium channel gamma-1 subunit-like [Haliotis cracherodii]|uniref:voltage-dependent calcium channel gamma-1 subunit-like n=1 Tax=Haliotis cracherodii TaxID=6455 RepID=UPI0039ED546E